MLPVDHLSWLGSGMSAEDSSQASFQITDGIDPMIAVWLAAY